MAKHYSLQELPGIIDDILRVKFKSKGEAAKALGVNVATISRACNGDYNERQPTEVMEALGLKFKTVVVKA